VPVGLGEMAGQVDGITGNVVIVPARLGSTRLPSKPLVEIAGVPLIIRVVEGLSGAPADRIIVATDSEEIASEVRRAGFEALITGEAASGTERVFKAWNLLGCPGKRIINVQGDEPAVTPSWIESVVETEPSSDLVVTLARRISEKEALSPSSVKTVLDNRSEALSTSVFTASVPNLSAHALPPDRHCCLRRKAWSSLHGWRMVLESGLWKVITMGWESTLPLTWTG